MNDLIPAGKKETTSALIEVTKEYPTCLQGSGAGWGGVVIGGVGGGGRGKEGG